MLSLRLKSRPPSPIPSLTSLCVSLISADLYYLLSLVRFGFNVFLLFPPFWIASLDHLCSFWVLNVGTQSYKFLLWDGFQDATEVVLCCVFFFICSQEFFSFLIYPLTYSSSFRKEFHIFTRGFSAMNNKNPETDLGVLFWRSEKQSSQAARELLPLWNLQTERERVPVSSSLIFLSSAGIKGVHHNCLTSMAN